MIIRNCFSKKRDKLYQSIDILLISPICGRMRLADSWAR